MNNLIIGKLAQVKILQDEVDKLREIQNQFIPESLQSGIIEKKILDIAFLNELKTGCKISKILYCVGLYVYREIDFEFTSLIDDELRRKLIRDVESEEGKKILNRVTSLLGFRRRSCTTYNPEDHIISVLSGLPYIRHASEYNSNLIVIFFKNGLKSNIVEFNTYISGKQRQVAFNSVTFKLYLLKDDHKVDLKIKSQYFSKHSNTVTLEYFF